MLNMCMMMCCVLAIVGADMIEKQSKKELNEQ